MIFTLVIGLTLALFLGMLGKSLVALLMVLLTRRSLRLGVLVGGSLSQIGEFSFILATMIAGPYKLLPTEAVNVITGVAILSITLNAALYRFVTMLVDILQAAGIRAERPPTQCTGSRGKPKPCAAGGAWLLRAAGSAGIEAL